MATSLIQIIDRWFDEYGAVLAGGKIHTYEAGTTTPLATYQDVDGSTPNANPVILDAAGTATIRLTNGVAYKLVLKDANDVTLDEADDITIGSAGSGTGEEYEVAFCAVGTPNASAFIYGRTFVRDVTFPANFAGAQGKIQTSPGAEYVITVKKNGTTVGTITIATNSTFAFGTSSGQTVAVSVGDNLSFHAPASSAASNFDVTLVGDVQ